MKTASAEEVKAQFNLYLKAVKKGPVVVTRNSKPIAIMLSVTDPDEVERIAMSQSKKLQRILRRSEKQIEKGKGIPNEEFWRQVEEMRKGH